MKINWLPLAAAVAFAAGSVSASAVDFNGYFRAGAQVNADRGEVYCLGTGADGHKVGRLGDECDTYGEIALGQNVYDKAGSKFSIHTLLAYGTTEGNRDLQGNSWQGVGGDGPWGGQRISFREVYAKYDTDGGYSIWSGKRFYRRKDIHIMDFYYLNNSGYGAGIEGINAGNGNLNFAVIKWANDGASADYNRNVYKLDARWDGINLGSVGALDASVIYAIPVISKQQRDVNEGDSRGNQGNSGALITLDLGSNFGSDIIVNNHAVAQWGSNGFAYVGAYKNHAGDNYTPDVDANGVRLIDWGTLDWGSNFDLGYSFLWAHLHSGSKHTGATWTYTRSGWEYQQFTPGKGFWSRPAIRFYASYIGGDQFADGWAVGYKNKNHGNHGYQFTFGTQVEAWW